MPESSETMEIDATVAEELEALNAGFDPDVDDNHVFEVLAQRCPPQPLVA